MRSPWPLSLGRPRRSPRPMATAPERAPVRRQSPTMRRACIWVSSTGAGGPRHILPLFEELRTVAGRNERGTALAASYRRGFL